MQYNRRLASWAGDMLAGREVVGVLQETSVVNSLVVSVSGNYLIAGSSNGSVSVSDLNKTVQGAQDAENRCACDRWMPALAMSPCGHYLLPGSSDKTVVEEWTGVSVCPLSMCLILTIRLREAHYVSVCLSVSEQIFSSCKSDVDGMVVRLCVYCSE